MQQLLIGGRERKTESGRSSSVLVLYFHSSAAPDLGQKSQGLGTLGGFGNLLCPYIASISHHGSSSLVQVESKRQAHFQRGVAITLPFQI